VHATIFGFHEYTSWTVTVVAHGGMNVVGVRAISAEIGDHFGLFQEPGYRYFLIDIRPEQAEIHDKWASLWFSERVFFFC